jgi:superfamily II DNA/RNA helicase
LTVSSARCSKARTSLSVRRDEYSIICVAARCQLDHVTFCTLDEADEMLALGFLEDMETILAMLPESRQLAFFSATMPPRIAA